MGNLSIWHWLIILVVVIVTFRTKELGSVGGDMGATIRNFKHAILNAKSKDFNFWFLVVAVLLLCVLIIAERFSAR